MLVLVLKYIQCHMKACPPSGFPLLFMEIYIRYDCFGFQYYCFPCWCGGYATSMIILITSEVLQ